MSNSDTELLLVDFDAVYWQAWHSQSAEDDADLCARRTVGRIREWSKSWEHVAVCHDVGRSWRHDVSSVYKANREAKPAHAMAQRRNALEQLRSEGFPLWSAEGYEADDVIASAAVAARARGAQVIIATADKDLHQLLGDGVRILDTRGGDFRGPEFVVEKWGVKVDQLGDWLALVGDASDNIAGVPKVGATTATKLLVAYGSILGILDAARDESSPLTPKLREALLASQQSLALGVRLVELRKDVPVDLEQALRPRRAQVTEPQFDSTQEDQVSDEQETHQSAQDDQPEQTSTSSAIVEFAPTQQVAEVKAIAIRPPDWQQSLEPQTLRDAYMLAKTLHNSRLFAGTFANESSIFAGVLLARAHGLETMKVLMPGMVHNIKGKLTLSAQMIVGLVLRSGKAEYFDCVESTSERAVYVTKRKGAKHEVRFEFSLEEARAAGYLGKPDSAWQKTPKTMLRHRCETELARAVYPDVVGGLYSPEEMLDADVRQERVA